MRINFEIKLKILYVMVIVHKNICELFANYKVKGNRVTLRIITVSPITILLNFKMSKFKYVLDR